MSELKCANATDGEKHEGPFYEKLHLRLNGVGHYIELPERAVICYACAKAIDPGLPEPMGFTFRVGPK